MVCLNTADDRRSPKHDRISPVLDLPQHRRSTVHVRIRVSVRARARKQLTLTLILT